jgi:hypothetical protein
VRPNPLEQALLVAHHFIGRHSPFPPDPNNKKPGARHFRVGLGRRNFPEALEQFGAHVTSTAENAL